MNQQQSSFSAVLSSSTRSNKRLRGGSGSTTGTTERSDNGTLQNPPMSATLMNDKSTSTNNVSLTIDTTSKNDIVNDSNDTNAINTHSNNNIIINNNNKRPRSRSSNTSNHQSLANGENAMPSEKDTSTSNNEDSITKSALSKASKESSLVPQMTEDYVELASHMMLYPLSQIRAANLIASGRTKTIATTTNASVKTNGVNNLDEGGEGIVDPKLRMIPQSQYLVHISALGYLKSSIRQPSVIETWSPYEIAVFEASIAEYGKNFSSIQKEIGRTKSIQDVIEFYYVWKKTSHYVQWKKEYIPEYLDVDVDEKGEPK